VKLLNPLGSDFPARSVSFTGTAGSTDPWNAGPQGVMVWSDQPCHVVVGEGVTATTADTPIPAYTSILFIVPLTVSGAWRVSAIQLAAGGTIYCKPINQR
jgi:phage terminase large subunit-like protein